MKDIRYTHGFKMHTPNLLHEIADSGLRDKSGVFKVPLTILTKYLASIAERASELNDPILNKLMCEMTLYEVADPESKEFDSKVLDKVYQDARDYINKKR